jgi:hypothetical protein
MLNERLGVEPHVVEVIVAHYPKGVAGIYNRARMLPRSAAPDHLRGVVTGEESEVKVIRFDKR